MPDSAPAGGKVAELVLPKTNWTLRRLVFFTVLLTITVAAVWRLGDLLADGGTTAIELAILAVFTVNFAWIAGAFVTACIGFCLKLFAARPVATAAPIIDLDRSRGAPTGRTAIVMPAYNEATAPLFAGLEALQNSLERTGHRRRFDLILLSDTRDPDLARAEEISVKAFRARHGGSDALLYRRRENNIGKKAGNIEEFCQNRGRDYDYMVVLDADSIMSGEAIVRLARLMDARPEAGIIQTLPRLVGQNTLFGRLEQFGYRLCCDVMALGLAFWQGPDGNYFGHNAIIRMGAFREHCRLPRLSGRGPLSGEIMSHDFVEAAMLRRAGYEIWFIPDGQGSYEGCPSNALDHAKRDRRWCQGNLQHAWLLGTPGLRSLSRLHLLIGITSYVASVWWLLLIILGIAASASLKVDPTYFPDGFSLFPTWPMDRSDEFFSLLMVTAVLLFMPKVLGLTLLMVDRQIPRGWEARLALLIGALLEALYSVLRAPILMVFHTLFISLVVLGRRIGWDAAIRDDRKIDLGAALRFHLPQTVAGVLLLGLTSWLAPGQIWWIVPVLAGLFGCVPLTMLTGHPAVGPICRRMGLFVIPEEAATPVELAHVTPAIEGRRAVVVRPADVSV